MAPDRRAHQVGGGVPQEGAHQHPERQQRAVRELPKQHPVGKRHAHPQNPEQDVGDPARSAVRCVTSEDECSRDRSDRHEQHRLGAVGERGERQQDHGGHARRAGGRWHAQQPVQLPHGGCPQQREGDREDQPPLENHAHGHRGGREGHCDPSTEIPERSRALFGRPPFLRLDSGVPASHLRLRSFPDIGRSGRGGPTRS